MCWTPFMITKLSCLRFHKKKAFGFTHLESALLAQILPSNNTTFLVRFFLFDQSSFSHSNQGRCEALLEQGGLSFKLLRSKKSRSKLEHLIVPPMFLPAGLVTWPGDLLSLRAQRFIRGGGTPKLQELVGEGILSSQRGWVINFEIG